jgi:RNA-binding protein
MPLTNSEIRQLKAKAQHLEPVVRVGKGGLTATVLQSIELALAARELIKIRLDHDRDERDVLAGKIAEATGAALVMQVGKVAVFYRRTPNAE